MEDLEIKVQAAAGAIECDFESMKAHIAEVLNEYKTATFTDDSIPTAKKVIADLRKQQKAFSGRIKDVKAAYMQPFEEFKAKADELVKLYDEPIEFINFQINDFEKRRIEEKQARIKEIYTATFGPISDLVPLEKVYNARWDNKTYILGDIEAELKDLVNKIITELNVIRSSTSGFAAKAEEIYLQDLNLAAAMQKMQEYDAVRAQELSEQKEAEIQRRIIEEKAMEHRIEMAKREAAATAIEAYIPEKSEAEPEAFLYCITLTPEEKECLEMYMTSAGIEFNEV